MSTLYEENVKRLLEEKKRRLEELIANIEEMERLNSQGYDDNNIIDDEGKRSSNTINKIREEIYKLEHEIHVLEMLYENYLSSMGAFRRTKGARKIR